MRKTLLVLALWGLCLCSAGCAGPGAALAEAAALQAEYAGAEALTVTGRITADYGDSVSRYTLRYEGSGEDGTLTVLAPDCVAGLRARFSRADGFTLVWDDVELYAGAVDPGGLTPADCLPVLLRCWCAGAVMDACRCTCLEQDALRVDFDLGDDITAVTWFGREDRLPLLAEFCQAEGSVVLTCQFQDVRISE